jgi:hypothetical protein
VGGQSESLSQLSAAKKFSADILIFEAALTQNPVDAISDLMRKPRSPLWVVTRNPIRNLPSKLLPPAVSRNCSRDVEARTSGGVTCAKVSEGHPWLDSRGTQWVLRSLSHPGIASHLTRPKVQLTPKDRSYAAS